MKKRRYLIKKINKYININKNFELKKILIKGLFSELRLSNAERYFYMLKYNVNFSVYTKIRFLCFQSYKTHSIYSFFNLYRINIRENLLYGNFSGFRKSSW